MKVSKNWLKEKLDISNISDDDLAKIINAHVCEIETYTKMVCATNLTIGLVHECVMHPDSNHLHVCQVEVAPNQITQIVCGAPNVRAGVKVIVALVGAVLPENFKIKASKIRGIESNGMLCSLQELGIEEKYVPQEFKDGIYLLDSTAPVGGNPLEYLGLDDYCIDLNVTSNRSDLLSMEGVCYDIAAALGKTYKKSDIKEVPYQNENDVNIEIQTDLCSQYSTRLFSNVKIKPSPLWMRSKLITCGIRPINNVVDITNYVLLEYGQPLHSFDAKKLGKQIVVRQAKDEEKLITLDSIERTLKNTDIVISNGKEALCLGGVMGGLSTEVLSTTTEVLLEAAAFDPLTIRKTSSSLGLKSESSTRFERKIDELRTVRALNRATELMVQLCDATVVGRMNTVIKKPFKQQSITVELCKINSLLGTNLSNKEITDIFTRLDYTYKESNGTATIELPSRRMDLEPSIQDIAEDVARMYGYDNIPTTIATSNEAGGLTLSQKRIRKIRHLLCDLGLNETISYSLINKKDLNMFTTQTRPAVEVLMPMTEDRAVMRQSLLNGVVEAVEYNKARKTSDIAFFEIGNRYFAGGQETMLAIAICGVFESNLWAMKKHVCDFYTIKGIVEEVFAHMNVELSFEGVSDLSDNLHPGRCAKVILKDKVIGYISELHPKYMQAHSLQDTYVCEICLEDILKLPIVEGYKSINKYPSIERDLAIVCNKEIPADSICKVIQKTAKSLLVDMKIFDVYTGENVEDDEKSLAIKLVFSDCSKTLETADVDKVVKSILNRLEYHFQAHLR